MLDYSLSLLIALIQVPTNDSTTSDQQASTNQQSSQRDNPSTANQPVSPQAPTHAQIKPDADQTPAGRPNTTSSTQGTSSRSRDTSIKPLETPASGLAPSSASQPSATHQAPPTTTSPQPPPPPRKEASTTANSVPPAKASQVLPKKDSPFTLGAQAFFRGEGILHPGLDDSKPDVGRVLQRIRANIKFHSGWLSGFVQAQDTRIWGFEQNPAISEANLDLHQGYLQASLDRPERKYSVWIRIGRQEIDIGRQRLIGSLPWAPAARSFNSVRVHGSVGKFEVDLIGSVLQPIRSVKEIDDSQNPPVETSRHYKGRHLSILRLAAHPHRAIEAELLGLYLQDDQDDPQADRRIANAGGRIWGRPFGGIFYDAEANIQFGKNGGKTHEAWAMAAQLGYEYLQTTVVPGIYGGFAMASGQSASSNKSKEFFNYFPTNHGHYGMVDLFGWRNMRNYELGSTLSWTKLIKANLTYHYFQLQEASGAWKNAGGALLGVDPLNRDRDLGHELDAMLTLRPLSPLMIQLGYGVFIPVGAGKSLTAPRQIGAQHFAYLWFVATF